MKTKKENNRNGFELKLDVVMFKPQQQQQLKATPKRAIPKQPRR